MLKINNKDILSILKSHRLTDFGKEEKLKIYLKETENSIEIVKKVLSGEFRYCQTCKGFYKSNEFDSIEKKENGHYEPYVHDQLPEHVSAIYEKTFFVCPNGHKNLVKEIITEEKSGEIHIAEFDEFGGKHYIK